MNTAVFLVVPGSAVRPENIATAADAYGVSPVFVAAAGGIDQQERAEYEVFGPLLEIAPEEPDHLVPRLRQYRPSGITTFSEAMVPLTAHMAEALDLPYHDRETTVLVTNKWEQRRRLAEQGVDAVWSVPVHSRAEALAALARRAGPVVIKPMRSQSSRDTYLLRDAGDLPPDVTPTADRPFVVEEYLRGRESGEHSSHISVEEVIVEGHVYTLGVTGKPPMLPPFREQGQFLPALLPVKEQEQLARLAADAATALGIQRGLMHTEIMLTPDGPRILEVNARIGGYIFEIYGRATGRDVLGYGVAVACGKPVEPVPAAPTGQVRFQYMNQPPVMGGLLRRVEGTDLVRQDPAVVDYICRVPAGTKLAPDVCTMWLDAIFGDAPDHRSMLEIIDRCLARMRFTFDHFDGVTRVWQATRGGLRLID